MTAAFFGLAGVIVGGLLQLLVQEIAARRARALDTARVRLLKTMLGDSNRTWRSVETCSRVIGANRDTTIRLLVMAGARGSERKNAEEKWGLVSRNPFTVKSKAVDASRGPTGDS